ncbi:MAG: hypothetical protein AB1498_10955 [bacterium]
MENEKKHLLDLISSFICIIAAGSVLSGLGRVISGVKLYSGIIDGFFISLTIYLSLFLPKIPFFGRVKIQHYYLLNTLIIGFVIGGIPGIILHDKFTFFASGFDSSLLCISFVMIESIEEKVINKAKLLFYYLLAGMTAGFIGNFIFNVLVEIKLLQSVDFKIVFLGAFYGAIWGGLIIVGIKLSLQYLKPLIRLCISPILLSALHGIVIAIGTGMFGIIVETITFTNTNFDLTATGATSLSQAITLSFIRDATFGLCFGFIFTLIPKLIPIKKLENLLLLVSGAIAGFLSPMFVQNFFLFVLSPIDGLLLGATVGFGILLSDIREEDKKKKRIWTLIFSPSFGFIALIISAFLKDPSKEKPFFYLLGFGILGVIYGFIITFFKFVCDYYLEEDQGEPPKII